MVYSQSTYLCKLLLFYHELSNFGDEILLKEGRNVTPDFSNPERQTQDDNIMNNWVLLYEFYWFNFLNKSIVGILTDLPEWYLNAML